MNACATELSATLADYSGEDCLIYGIGNIGRQDDGLGWAVIDWLESEGLYPAAQLVRHYQLQLEDADLISQKRRVLFVDASKSTAFTGVQIESVQARMDSSFTSHAVSLPTILATCQTCFGRIPEVQLLTIKGYVWELQMGLSEGAASNLEQAKQLFLQAKGFER